MIELIEVDDGVLFALKIDGEIYYEGYSIPHEIWIDILTKNNFEVKESSIDFVDYCKKYRK